MDVLAPILGSVGILATLGWILRSYLGHRRQLKTTVLQAELQGKLLDKFNSTDDLRTYLESDVGERFLLSATIEQASPLRRILGSVQVGLILTAAGSILQSLNSTGVAGATVSLTATTGSIGESSSSALTSRSVSVV